MEIMHQCVFLHYAIVCIRCTQIGFQSAKGKGTQVTVTSCSVDICNVFNFQYLKYWQMYLVSYQGENAPRLVSYGLPPHMIYPE